jgi:hypothetical protein
MLIFSVYRPKDRRINICNAERVADLLRRNQIDFDVLDGHYSGAHEISFRVPDVFEPLVKAICETHSQECYLRIDLLGQGFLVYPDRVDAIGRIRYLDRPKGDYTYNRNTGAYFKVA